ncbi:hypothetical protein C8F01DRAFT_78325 [Mycena amicta]|nr:hypothetical protein C8F01DRAFT_78325 [Mycena amicta]
MSAFAGRLRQLHSLPARRPYSSFFSKAGGGGRYFNAHKSAKPGKDATSETTEASSAASSKPVSNGTTQLLTPNPAHPIVELNDLHLHRFFSLHRPLLLLHDPASILNSPHPSIPLLAHEQYTSDSLAAEQSLVDQLRLPDPDAEAARQLTRALTITRAGAAVSWESALQRLGLDVGSEALGVQAAEWNDEWEDILADSTKRKRRKKMKKHKLRKRRKLTRAERLKLK